MVRWQSNRNELGCCIVTDRGRRCLLGVLDAINLSLVTDLLLIIIGCDKVSRVTTAKDDKSAAPNYGHSEEGNNGDWPRIPRPVSVGLVHKTKSNCEIAIWRGKEFL
jgi:hypothetical protein